MFLWQRSFHNMSAILAAILDFSKKTIFHKIAANFTEISRKHVFAASNRNTIKNRVKKKPNLCMTSVVRTVRKCFN